MCLQKSRGDAKVQSVTFFSLWFQQVQGQALNAHSPAVMWACWDSCHEHKQ